MSDIGDVLLTLEERRANIRLELAGVLADKRDPDIIARLTAEYVAVTDALLRLRPAEEITRRYQKHCLPTAAAAYQPAIA